MTRYTTPSKTNVTTTKKLGQGGEGAVFDVAGQSGLVAKIYHPHRLNASLAAKVTAMTRNPPEDATRATLNHVSIAWPIDVLYSGKQFAGYTMPKIKKSDDLYDLLQPQQRAKQHGSLNHRHLYRSARNLALAIDAIHQKGYVVGDVNFKNALFNDDALITMVDCDSMQVTDSAGIVHHCLVGVPEYTPAELQGVDFSRMTRTKNHDAFGLAVLIFQLLMQGFHPFAGKPRPGEKDIEQSHIYCISKGIFPYISNQPYEPPRAAPSMLSLPVLIQQQFERAFTQPNARPTPKDWATVLAMVEPRLIPCPNDAAHWYPSDGHCVICEIDYNVGRRTRTGPKPSATVQMQVPLPPSPSSTTGPLRPSAISKPVVNAPQSRPPTPPVAQPPRPAPATPRPAKPATPKPTVAPAPQSRPVAPPPPSQSLPPLVSPQSAPRVVPPTPQPRQPQVDIVALVTAFISAHRIVLVPVAVILMALAIALSSSWNSSTTPLPDSPVIVVAEPTATVFAEPTAVSAPTAQQLQPTEIVSSSIPCTPEGIVAAHWPMLPADVQEEMYTKPLILNKKVYNSPVIELNVNTLNSVPSNAAQRNTFAEIQAKCGSPQLIRSNPLAYYPDDITQTTALCVAPGCEIVASEYRAVLVKNDIAKADTRELFGAFDLMFHFLNKRTPLKVYQVGFLGDKLTGSKSLQKLMLPFVQTRILKFVDGKPEWQNTLNGTESTMVSISPGDTVYIEAVGITTASKEQELVQFFRTITLPNRNRNDGPTVSASDYVKGYEQNINAVKGLITAVEASGDNSIIIRYIPGLPKELADAIGPAALYDEDFLIESTGEWLVSRDGESFDLTHLDDRRSFTLSFLYVEQHELDLKILVDRLYKDNDDNDDKDENAYDVFISDSVVTPQLLNEIAKNTKSNDTEFGYTIRLVPTGALWVLQK